MRKLIKKAHDSLDRIEKILEVAQIKDAERKEQEAFIDMVFEHGWGLYYINRDNAVAVTRCPMRLQ